ncbi:TonB-dependent receptor domain-containing protein [Sphingomonas canadensis]|uniref:TonB-dependent receptor domain-containing protein n=1 Tax=Sphingomonas canadensis TaxID=1219257 RepID=A0ABW3H9I5_9SPHN|nr:TonB-dependent receptor [Sphingomonas canadensis]MCW3836980.1 TonB-dependent receptor [Sphingomonas canadensis]
MVALRSTRRLAGSARLCVSTSLLALGLSVASPALAQEAAQEEEGAAAQSGDAIVVTGTRIQGINPVGSAVIPVGRDEIEELGVTTTNDALRKLPQVVNFGGSNDQSGGSVIQNTSLNTFFAKSVNLRGLGTASTLSLVNGHRVAPQGPNGQLFDADNIPAIALERIEVVADGGSAIYGSDAIAGVVNYIIRRPEDVAEVQFRAGFADSVQEYTGSVGFGRRWDTGGIFVAYEYQKRTALEADDRPDLYNSDLSAYGGGLNPLFSNPANVQFANNGTPYGIPAGQNGSAITLGSLTTTANRMNPWTGADAVPSGKRNTVVGSFEQELGASVKFKADGFFSRREYKLDGIPQTATLSVPNTNPFSPCAVGKADNSATLDCPASGTVLVPYNFLYDLGPATATGYEQLWSLSGGFDVDFGGSWHANLTGYYSEDEGDSRTDNLINGNGLNRALGATVAGTAKPAGVPYLNPFCDGSAFDCNSDATVDLFRAFTEIGSKFELYGFTGSVGGSLFSLPGGDVRVAVGGEYHHDFLSGTGQISNTRTDNVGVVTAIPVSNQRSVKSGYAEMFVPVFGSGNAIPGIERLEIDAAIRYDKYSDVGSTTNPKIGVNYVPVQGVTFRGSYGTSFRAPSLVDVNKYATAGFLPRTGTGTAVGLTPANGSFLYVYPIGGNPNLRPEQAETWSFGVDIAPEAISGLHASLTYYNIVYTDKIDTAAYNAPIGGVLSSGQYDDFIVFNPNYFPGKATMTLAQFVSYWNSITADPNLPYLGAPPDPTTIIAIVDARRNNSGVVKTDGLDFSFDYAIESPWATFNIGGQANYTFHYKSAPVPAAPLADEVNHFGYPARFAGRMEFGLQKDGFGATTFINYVNGRKITRTFLPASVPDQYLNIDSYTTVDLSLRYSFGDGDSLLGGLKLSASVVNLFDAKPPLVVNTGGSPIRFDPSYSSSLGRFFSFGISKKF